MYLRTEKVEVVYGRHQNVWVKVEGKVYFDEDYIEPVSFVEFLSPRTPANKAMKIIKKEARKEAIKKLKDGWSSTILKNRLVGKNIEL